MNNTQAVIVGYGRTPFADSTKDAEPAFGKAERPGALADVIPVELAKTVGLGLLRQTRLDVQQLATVICGCANPSGAQDANIGRMVAVALCREFGWEADPLTGHTVNKLCASSMEAAVQAATRIWSGREGDTIIMVLGVDSMSAVSMYSLANGMSAKVRNTAGTIAMFMGLCAEEQYGRYFEQFDVSREAQDRMALASHVNTATAWESGWMEGEVFPVTTPNGVVVGRDTHFRSDTSMEALAKLRPSFDKGGNVTAGNSSGICDGASGMILCSDERARMLGLRPLARIVSYGDAGVDPAIMGDGVTPAVLTALGRANLRPQDIDLWEINEAFAIVGVTAVNRLGIDPTKVNANGGAIALGHPLGASGARIIGTLARSLITKNKRLGVAALCVGFGMGVAVVIENMQYNPNNGGDS